MDESNKDSYVLIGHPVLLVCGYDLHSNPQATITWTDPRGNKVTESNRYSADNGPELVQLNITRASKRDSGTGRCSVNVISAYNSFVWLKNFSDVYNRTQEVEINLSVVGESMRVYILSNYIHC